MQFNKPNFTPNPYEDIFFTIFPIFFAVIFIIVLGIIMFVIIKGIRTWCYNNSQPVLTVVAKVVTKRINTSSRGHHGDNFSHIHTTSSSYYVTFEVESGSRMEFYVSGKEYGLLAEKDIGNLTFQGTRYLSFKRD